MKIRPILKDIKVELDDEFDRNFERKAFFDQPWAPVKSDPGIGSLLNRTGALRSSIRSSISASGITYESDVPYAQIHNDGGEIKQSIRVTDKMRRWAWAMYMNTKQDMYKGMALTKKQTINRTVRIPARPFIGAHSFVDNAVDNIVEGHVQNYADELISNMLKK